MGRVFGTYGAESDDVMAKRSVGEWILTNGIKKVAPRCHRTPRVVDDGPGFCASVCLPRFVGVWYNRSSLSKMLDSSRGCRIRGAGDWLPTGGPHSCRKMVSETGWD